MMSITTTTVVSLCLSGVGLLLGGLAFKELKERHGKGEFCKEMLLTVLCTSVTLAYSDAPYLWKEFMLLCSAARWDTSWPVAVGGVVSLVLNSEEFKKMML